MRRTFSHIHRKEEIQRVSSEIYDVVVVGGGITGAGIALDATLRGLRVALLEKADLGSGTSSKSSKLVHGGLRYLEQYEFGLVMESTAERALLMRHVSHLVRPLRFLYPVYKSHKHGPFFIRLGMWLYDLLSLFRNHKRHAQLSPAEVAKEEPHLEIGTLRAAMAYYDCITDDARLTLENAKAAHQRGATVLTRVEVTGFQKGKQGDPSIVQARDAWTQETFEVQTRRVINAAGPWTNQLLQQEARTRTKIVRPTKGIHLVVPRAKLPISSAIVVNSPEDNRIAFVIPWDENTAIGTTDTDYDGPLDDVRATRKDVDYLLEAIHSSFPQTQITDADILSTWAGLRPLIADDSENPYMTSREHAIMEDDEGVITIAGGKLTTYRRMAEECVDTLIRSLGLLSTPGQDKTKGYLLPGAQSLNYRKDGKKAVEEAMTHGLTHEIAERLVERYGGLWKEVLSFVKPGESPALLDPLGRVLECEVDFGVHTEIVGGLEDFLVRRTHLFYHLPDQGMKAATRAVEIIGERLEWNAERRTRELQSYENLIAENRSWRA